MKALILDWFNLIKRYTYSYNLEEMEPGEIIDNLTYSILNRIDDVIYNTKPDIIFICSDSGFNKRAASLIEGYKANRKKHKTLSEEEKEKDYIEFLKTLAQKLPVIYIELNDIEADMIIRCVVNYLHNIDENINITIASGDSDMIQLLNKRVTILDWNKGDINLNNWVNKIEKVENYFNSQNYALAKAIVGDPSDNIKGIYGIGWKKIFKIFDIIHEIYGKDYIIQNVNDFIDLIDKILYNTDGLDKKIIKNLTSFRNALKENQNTIHKNMLVIDLNMIETPYLYKIISNINDGLKNINKKFNTYDVLKFLKFQKYQSTDINDTEYKEIIRKNSKALNTYNYIQKKSIIAASSLLRKG